MPRFNALAAAAVLLGLAGLTACNRHNSANQGTGSSGPVDAGKVVDAAAAETHPRAGRWEALVTINHMDMAGMAPQMRDAMQHAFAGGAPIATCLTPEQAARPSAAFFSGRRHDCVYDSFTMADGNLNAVMHCSTATGHMKATMTGTYNENSYNLHSTSTSEMPGGKTLSQDMTVKSKWVGACTGTEANTKHKD